MGAVQQPLAHRQPPHALAVEVADAGYMSD
jgi:hypothetical protein